jgi:hypothetical protein
MPGMGDPPAGVARFVLAAAEKQSSDLSVGRRGFITDGVCESLSLVLLAEEHTGARGAHRFDPLTKRVAVGFFNLVAPASPNGASAW